MSKIKCINAKVEYLGVLQQVIHYSRVIYELPSPLQILQIVWQELHRHHLLSIRTTET